MYPKWDIPSSLCTKLLDKRVANDKYNIEKFDFSNPKFQQKYWKLVSTYDCYFRQLKFPQMQTSFRLMQINIPLM